MPERTGPTRRGVTVTVGGVALYGAGVALGYPELVVVGAGAFASLLLAMAAIGWRPKVRLTRTLSRNGSPSTSRRRRCWR